MIPIAVVPEKCCQSEIVPVLQARFRRLIHPAVNTAFLAALLALVPLPSAVGQPPVDTERQPDANLGGKKFENISRWYTRQAKWNGFDQFHFHCVGRDAYLVMPPTTLPGRPWIWRARFPDFHAEMDIELIRAGYHLAYFDVADQFGCPAIIDKATEFYHLVVDRHELAPRPVLEGVSRGGLFVYNWAAAHPHWVACIYCDTPVCDFRSWPGGKGMGIGSPAAWKRCLAAYGFTASQALVFDQQPLDRANTIAAAAIPILHIVSENDRVVPPQENTYLLRDALRKLGHDMEIISVPEGTRKSNGHHFDHPDPDRVVQFIRRHAEKTDDIDAD